MLAYDYPLLGLFWTMLIVFLWVAWLMLVFSVIVDIFRSEISGVAKGLWSLFVVVLPWLGVLIYLITNGSEMSARQVAAAKASEAEVQSYVRNLAGGVSTADEIAKLADLHAKGTLSDAEFAQLKAKLLA